MVCIQRELEGEVESLSDEKKLLGNGDIRKEEINIAIKEIES